MTDLSILKTPRAKAFDVRISSGCPSSISISAVVWWRAECAHSWLVFTVACQALSFSNTLSLSSSVTLSHTKTNVHSHPRTHSV